ncbi:transglycosylase domain-containing protein [Bacteroidales bacterium]|nr:transglycosylase domain-containing protein [Bacteroidales bacterium]
MTAKNKYNLIFWSLFSLPFIIIVVIFSMINNGKMGYMPSMEDLANPKSDLAAQIITEDGELLQKIYMNNTTRVRTNYKNLSPYLVDALIATEDIRFHTHSGIDIRGLMRVLFRTVIKGDASGGGGSTVTQQLAKQLFPREFDPEMSSLQRKLKLVTSKFKEWVTAVKLEKNYTKQEIITLYFDQFDFLYSAVGIQSSANRYFNKTPDSLNIEEAAMLVGMLKNPSLYNPKRNDSIATIRRNVVLSQMKKYEYISQEVYDSVSALPIKLNFQRIGRNTGYGTYFKKYIRLTMERPEPQRKRYKHYESYQKDSARWVDNPLRGWCYKNPKPNGERYSLYSDGLKIYSTINYKMQRYAEEAMREHLSETLQPMFDKEVKNLAYPPFGKNVTVNFRTLIMNEAFKRSERYRNGKNAGLSDDEIRAQFDKKYHMTIFSWNGSIDTLMTPWDSIKYYKKFMHSGMMSVEPFTGHARTYVGGLDLGYFAYDHVTQGKRQAGSTFKPFLYILAMQSGLSPCHPVHIVPTIFKLHDTIWTPGTTTNERYLNTQQTLKWGLAHSDNYVSAWLVNQFNPVPIAKIAYKMGIESFIDPVPSMIYGTSDMSVYEMVSAYTTFANKGVNIKPTFVTRIADKHGNIISNFVPETEDAINEQTAYLMLNLMQDVVNQGSGRRLRRDYKFTGEIAGKTGTTQNNADGWFMGITPKLVTGVWVGCEDRAVRFQYTAHGQGATMALPIWGKFMEKVYADSTLGITQEDEFEIPQKLNINTDCEENSADEFDFGWN